MTNEDWEESLNLGVRFAWATPEQQKHLLAEIKFQRKQIIKEILSYLKPSGRGDSYEISATKVNLLQEKI